jgi:hypothetical protein
MADRSLEDRFPPRVFVEGNRAIHRRPAFAGEESDGMYRVRDIFVLGPRRDDKRVADQDAIAFRTAYEAGLAKLHEVICKAHAAAPDCGELCFPPCRMVGWECEREMTSDGVKKSRAVCLIKTSDTGVGADLIRIEGPWQKHHRSTESNLSSLQLAFRQEGLAGIRHVAGVQAMVTAPVEPFRLPPCFKRFKVDQASQTG